MKLLDYFPHGVGFVLVFDFMPSGLWEVIHDVENPVTEPQIKTYMHMLMSGVDYLHEHNIMHRVICLYAYKCTYNYFGTE